TPPENNNLKPFFPPPPPPPPTTTTTRITNRKLPFLAALAALVFALALVNCVDLIDTSEETKTTQTPTKADFNITGLSQLYNGSPRAVKITRKSGKSNGTITVYYEGTDGTAYDKSTAAPSLIGTYAVTFDVAERGDWKAASGLSAGTLDIYGTTPKAADFTFSGLSQFYDGNTKTLSISPKSGKSAGTITVYYEGTGGTAYNKGIVPPTLIGTYAVTFDVAEDGVWEAVSGLSAGTLTITAPALTGTPTVTGNPTVGNTLAADTGGLNGTGTYSYEWKRGNTQAAVNTPIGGNQDTYTLSPSDKGAYITVTVTCSGNSGRRTSAAVGPVMEAAQGADLAAKLAWLKANAQSDTIYAVTVDKDEQLAGTAYDGSNDNNLGYSGKSNVTVLLEGVGGERAISLSSNGSLFTADSGVTLILGNGITLKGKSSNNEAIVTVHSGGSLTMQAGAKLTGNTLPQWDWGGGVFVNGTFTMNGGEISGNAVGDYAGGGGVYVGGTFTMNGGKISGNTASSSSYDSGFGGGVYVAGTFTMNGGEISGNAVGDYAGGGGVYVGGTFTMNGGRISGNTANSIGSGGGVCMDGGTFTMNGGEISGNNATAFTPFGGGGGVAMFHESSFTMSGGKISDNTAFYNGGGVVVMNSTFTMLNGEISGNTADFQGGGVDVYSGTFRIVTGTIYGSNGGTVALRNTAENGAALFKMDSSCVVQCGTFNGTTWNGTSLMLSQRQLYAFHYSYYTNSTIKVVNGNLQ
ncbi:MAG: MBG domain-containing protein, partial [Treponema sp.]|nr:MBG domain-containing protein [Treponema sp.]